MISFQELSTQLFILHWLQVVKFIIIVEALDNIVDINKDCISSKDMEEGGIIKGAFNSLMAWKHCAFFDYFMAIAVFINHLRNLNYLLLVNIPNFKLDQNLHLYLICLNYTYFLQNFNFIYSSVIFFIFHVLSLYSFLDHHLKNSF